MEHVVEQLIVYLEQTRAAYNRVMDIIDAEKGAAIAWDIQRFAAAGGEKQLAMARIERLDRDRTQLITQLAGYLNLPISRLTLTDLARRVGPPQRHRLEQLNGELGDLLEKVRAANDECRTLIDHCRRLVQNTLGFFQHWTGASEVYGATGHICNSPLRGGRRVSGVV